MTEQQRAPLDQTAQLWALLYGTWGSPRRASRMTSHRDHDRKYSDIATYSFNASHLVAHLAGTTTYAATLGAAGTARAGCKDYDSADEAEILAALDQAQQKGITAAAIVIPGRAGEHTGGHLWVFYDRPYAESDIRAQLRTIRRSGKGEDYPSGNPIRLPFGYHKIKKTRGTLILQDGRRFNLDTQFAAGFDALLSLPRNGKPEPAPASDARIGGTSWGEAYHAEHWQNLPDGGPLWHSPYIAAAAKRPGRENLAKLLRGERVTVIKKDDTRDDSDSAQVAALAYNLLSADVCKPQARAIADYLYSQIRPGKTREHYRAHFDVELERYTPKCYRPQMIRSLGPANNATPQPLPPAEYKPEPKSRARHDRPQRVTGPSGYLAWLRSQVDPQSDSVMLSQAQCAERLGCCVRTIKRYEKALGPQIERRVFAQRQAGCLFILSPDVVTTSPADVVIADAEAAQQNAENAQPATTYVEHTAPPVTLPPAAPPEAGPAEPPALCAAVCEAFDVYANRPMIQRKKGKKGKPRRAPLRRKMIAGYIASNYPDLHYTDEALDQAIAAERQARKLADLPMLAAGTLKAEIRHAESLCDKSKAAGDNAWRWWLVYRDAARRELASRPPEPGRKPRKNCEVLPDLRAAGERYYGELFDLANQARATMPRPAPIAVAKSTASGGVSGRVCSPHSPPAAAGPVTLVMELTPTTYTADYVPRMVERLKAQRQSAA